MESITPFKSWAPLLSDPAIPSLSISLLCISAVALFLYGSNFKMKKELVSKKEKVKALKGKLKALSALLKKKDREIGQLILAHETYDPLYSSDDSEGKFTPISSHIPKLNEGKRHNTKSFDCPKLDSKISENIACHGNMNVTFRSLERVAGDTILEEELTLSKYQQGRIDEFKELLTDSQDWKIIKNFTKCSIEVRISDVIKNGLPYCRMSCILEGIKPQDVFKLFSDDICDQYSWNPHCKSVDEYVPEEGVRILRTRVKLPLVSNREFIDRVTAFYYPQDDKYYSFSKGVSPSEFEYKEEFPKSNKYVRGLVYFNGYVFSECDDGNSTQITQIIQSDVKGYVPKFIVNRVTPNGMYDLVVNLDKALRNK